MSPAFRRLTLVAAVVALTLFALDMLADNPWTQRWVSRLVASKTREYTNIDLEFQALRLRVLPLGVDLFGVRVRRQGQGAETLASASQIRGRVSLWSLVMGEPRIGLIEATDLEAAWPVIGGLESLFKEMPPPKEPVAPCPRYWPPCVEIPVERLSLRNARLFARLPKVDEVPRTPEDYYIGASGLDLDLWNHAWDDMSVRLNIAALNVADGPMSYLEDTRVKLDATLSGTTITTDQLMVAGPRVSLDGRLLGELLMPEGGDLRGVKVTMDAGGQADLSLLGSYLQLDDTRGRIDATTRMELYVPTQADKKTKFKLTGTGQAHDGRMYGFRLHNSRARFAVDAEKFAIEEADVIIGDRAVGTVRGKMGFSDSLPFKFEAKPDGITMTELLGALAVDFNVFNTDIHSPSLKIEGQGWPFKMSVRGSGMLTNIELPPYPYDHARFPDPPACELTVNMAIDPYGLRWDGSRGKCFSVTRAQAKALGPRAMSGNTSPPSEGRHVSEYTLSGPITFSSASGLDMRIALPRLELAAGQWFAQMPLSGQAIVEARVHGPYSDVLIDVPFKASDVSVEGVALGSVEGETHVDNTAVSWQGVAIQPTTGGRIDLPRGRLLFDEDSTIELEASMEGLSGDTTAAWLEQMGVAGWSIEGRKTVFSLKGPLMHPLGWTGRIDLGLGPIWYEGSPILDGVDGTLIGGPKGWSTEGIRGRDNAWSLRLAGRQERAKPFSRPDAEASKDLWEQLGWGAGDRWTLEIDSKSLRRTRVISRGQETSRQTSVIQSLPVIGEILRGVGIEGTPEVEVRASGTRASYEGRFQGSLSDFSVFGGQLAPLRFHGFLVNDRLDLMIGQAGASLEGRLNLDLSSPQLPYEWYFHASKWDLRFLGPALFHQDPRNFAFLTASWSMKGKLTDWWRSVGMLDIEDARLRFVGGQEGSPIVSDLGLESRARMTIGNGGWIFDKPEGIALRGRHGRVSLRTGDNKLPERFDLGLDGMIDLGLLREAFPAVEVATGKVRIEGSMEGSAATPKLTVRVRDARAEDVGSQLFEPITIGTAAIRPPLKNVRLDARFDGEKILIDELLTEKGTGTIRATGVVGIPSTGTTPSVDTSLNVTLNNAGVVYPVGVLKSFDSALSGSLTVSGAKAPWNVGGSIVVSRARSTREVDIRDEIVEALKRQAGEVDLGPRDPIVNLDLSVQVPGSIVVNNRNIQAVVGGVLQIQGTDQRPIVTGQMEVSRGRFVYRRDFRMTRGLVTFDDPVRPDPRLDINAVSEVGSYRVFVNITGRASNAKVDLSIDPATREDGIPINKMEILVLLSTGTMPDSTRAVGETQMAARTEALNLVVGQFEEPVERLFDMSGQSVVRQVYIDTYSEEGTGTPIARFNVPLNIVDKLDAVMRYDQSGNWRGSIEYALHDSISVSGILDGQSKNELQTNQSKGVGGDTGVDLKFRFSFP